MAKLNTFPPYYFFSSSTIFEKISGITSFLDSYVLDLDLDLDLGLFLESVLDLVESVDLEVDLERIDLDLLLTDVLEVDLEGDFILVIS